MIQRIKPYASTVLAFGVVLAVYGLFWTLIRGRLEPVGEATLIVGLVAIAAYVALESERVGAATPWSWSWPWPASRSWSTCWRRAITSGST